MKVVTNLLPPIFVGGLIVCMEEIMKIITLILVIVGLTFAVFYNTKDCRTNPGVAIAELASETPFDAKTFEEAKYRNEQRIQKFFSVCN